MVAQVYLDTRIKFLETYVNGRFTKEIYLGDVETFSVISDPNNSFTSLGGSSSNPLIYTYENTGMTEFNLCIQSPLDSNTALWELWIDGDKTYYYSFEQRNSNIFDRTVSVKATQGNSTKFKFRITILNIPQEPPILYQYYFEGDPNIVYSSITAKFIS